MDRILSVTPSGMAAATELTVASLVNPTELNSLGLAVPDWRVCRTVGAGTDDATWYRLDASSAGVSAPYVMASATAGLRWVAIAGRYINSAVAINGALTLPTTPLAASSGGTGQASYVVGDVLFASGVAALSALADVAVGNSLISGGVGVAPAWGKIALTTHVSGILPSANGGTGINNAGSITNASNTIITGGGTLALGGFTLTAPATGTAVLTTTAQSIAGIKTFSDTTSASSSTVGAVVVGNGTAATSVAFGAGNINAGGTLTTGGNITTSQSAGSTWNNTSTAAGSTINLRSATGNLSVLNLIVNGVVVGSISGSAGNGFYVSDGANGWNPIVYTSGAVAAGTVTFAGTLDATSSTSAAVATAGGLAVAKGQWIGTFLSVGTTIAVGSTTDATAIGTASVVQSGGQSTAKNILAGQSIAAGVTSTATAAGTTTLTNASRRTQIFTGVTTQTLQMPAANLFGAGVAVEIVVINRSTGSVTASRAGADTFVGGGTTDVITTLTQRYYVSDGVSVWYSLAV